mmetsp:Transcript_42015/g.84904  ORF Transcript_42015/g.84904 Transcript_42015/m.84904 type:complete len:100 (+) Transcript_42015:119-418(+)
MRGLGLRSWFLIKYTGSSKSARCGQSATAAGYMHRYAAVYKILACVEMHHQQQRHLRLIQLSSPREITVSFLLVHSSSSSLTALLTAPQSPPSLPSLSS